jgi:hypothetical protein
MAGLYRDAEKSLEDSIAFSQGKRRFDRENRSVSCSPGEVDAYVELIGMQISAEQCDKASKTLKDAMSTNSACGEWRKDDWRGGIHCPKK